MSHRAKAQEYFAEGDYSKAINFYTLAIRDDDSNTKLYLARAKSYYFNSKDLSQVQWKKVLDDCTTALNLDKQNYDAMYYSGLAYVYGFKKIEKGLKLMMEAYEKSLGRSKNYKQYTLPQQIYQDILKVKKLKQKLEWEEHLTNANPFFNKLVYLLQETYDKEVEELRSKDVKKDVFDYGVTKLAVQYNKEIRELVEMFELRYNGTLDDKMKVDPPDFLCDPISFNLLHDPVITPSGHSYEKSWLFQHLAHNEYDPLTRQKLTKDQCYPNLSLKSCVELYSSKYSL
ncbi:STUB1 E3 ubiquitin-protein ligase CHIP [Candida maltosa Xu316]